MWRHGEAGLFGVFLRNGGASFLRAIGYYDGFNILLEIKRIWAEFYWTLSWILVKSYQVIFRVFDETCQNLPPIQLLGAFWKLL